MLGFVLKDALQLGLIWSLLAIGVFISFKILDFADLTAEGSITLGSSIVATFIVNEQSLLLAFIFVLLFGFLSGVITGLLHTKLKIPAILAGIISMTGLYSINLLVLNKANVSLLRKPNIYTFLRELINDPFIAKTLTTLVIVSLVFLLLYLLFGTEIGMSIRATGMNKKMAKAQGINTDLMVIIGLGLSNAIIALGGSLIAQSNNVATLEMGRGTIVIGLASIIIGEAIFGNKTFKIWLFSVIIGSIIYQLLIGVALSLGLKTNLLQLIQSILIAVILAIPIIKKLLVNDEVLAYDRIK